jgi:hypothetical protein
MGEWLLPRRDRLIVARHEVPGCGVWTFERAKTSGRSASRRGQDDRSQARSAWKSPSKVPSRRVRYDRAQPIPEVFLGEMGAMSNRCAHLHESYRTLRDGSLGWRYSRQFVPGYDRIVSLGHYSSLSRASRHLVPGYNHAVPLGQNTFLPAEPLIKLTLMGATRSPGAGNKTSGFAKP